MGSPDRHRSNCPRCGESLLRTDARSLSEKFMRRVLGRRRVCCRDCGYRQWVHAEGRGGHHPAVALPLANPHDEYSRSADYLGELRVRSGLFAALLVLLAGLAVWLLWEGW